MSPMLALYFIAIFLSAIKLISGEFERTTGKESLVNVVLPELPNSFQWRDLTQDELTKWYTPADLCVLDNPEISSFPQDIRARNCTKYSGGNRRMFCGVGMGNNNYPCYGPFGSARPSFKRGVVGFTDASDKPLLQAFSNLLRRKTLLVFLGDSTMRQKLQALECELRREDPRIKFHGNLFGILPCDTTLKVYFPDGQMTEVHSISLGPKSIGCLKGGLGDKAPGGGVFENPASIIKNINTQLNQSVVVVANMGLWYNDETEYGKVVPPVLEWLNSISGRPNYLQDDSDPVRKDISNIITWHETVSQHWVSPSGSGYFFKPMVDAQETAWGDWGKVPLDQFMVPNCCTRVTNTSFMADWRNDIVKENIRGNADYKKKIILLPVADITRYAICTMI